jgi:hypothetical protein
MRDQRFTNLLEIIVEGGPIGIEECDGDGLQMAGVSRRSHGEIRVEQRRFWQGPVRTTPRHGLAHRLTRALEQPRRELILLSPVTH